MAVRQKESVLVVDPMIRMFRSRGWKCVNMVAGFTTKGLADYWVYHRNYGDRWIEFKRLDRKGNLISHLTKAQKEQFPIQYKAGIRLYCVAAFDLRGSKNYHLRKKHYFRVVNCSPNIMNLVNPLKRRELNV